MLRVSTKQAEVFLRTATTTTCRALSSASSPASSHARAHAVRGSSLFRRTSATVARAAVTGMRPSPQQQPTMSNNNNNSGVFALVPPPAPSRHSHQHLTRHMSTTPTNPNEKTAEVPQETRNILNKGLWGKVVNFGITLMGYYGEESTRIRQSQSLYRSIEFQSTKPLFINALGLETSFQSTQQLIMLHTWMIHKQLLKKGKGGRLLQEEIFDTLWDDTMRRIRSTGVHELTVNKHLRDVQKWSFGACVSYDHGVSITDDKDFELGSALWRNLFASKPTADEGKVYAVAKYVRKTLDMLDTVSKEDLYSGAIPWCVPPTHKLSAAEVEELSVDHRQKGKWRKAMAVDGRWFWWNLETRESAWEIPSASNNEKEGEMKSGEASSSATASSSSPPPAPSSSASNNKVDVKKTEAQPPIAPSPSSSSPSSSL